MEQDQINVKFLEFNIPFTDATGRASANWGGKNRILIIQGAHSGSGGTGSTQQAKLLSFITAMETWVNANIQSSAIYTNSFGVTATVDAVDWSWKRSFNDPNRIIYNLIMKEK